MKRECDRILSASRRDMACAMPASIAYAGAEQFNNALRFNFLAFGLREGPSARDARFEPRVQ